MRRNFVASPFVLSVLASGCAPSTVSPGPQGLPAEGQDRAKSFSAVVGEPELPMPYLGKRGFSAVAIEARPRSFLGQDISSAVRADLRVDAGGGYGGGVQSGYPVFNAEEELGTAGQALGYWGYINGRGKGNALFAAAVVQCYGGGEVGPEDATPECSPLGEFEASTGNLIFEATVRGSSGPSRRVTFDDARHLECIGSRYVLNGSRPGYSSGALASIEGVSGRRGSRLSFTGADFRSLDTRASWYVKIGSTRDDYAPACGSACVCEGDDVCLDNGGSCDQAKCSDGTCRCIGHWYRAKLDGSNVVVTGMPYDTTSLTSRPGAPFILRQGTEIVAYDAKGRTLDLDQDVAWGEGDRIYSPPNHIIGFNGLNLILHKTFKTGSGTVASNGVRLVNYGPGAVDRAIWISGGGKGRGGFRNGIVFAGMDPAGVALDLRGTDVGAALSVRTSDGHNNRIVLGSNGEAQIAYEGTRLVASGAALEVTNGLGDVAADGPGLKHLRGAVGCTTAPRLGATCTSPEQRWRGKSFSDTRYTLTCTLESPRGTPIVSSVKKMEDRFTITIASLAASESGGDYDCIAIHDRH